MQVRVQCGLTVGGAGRPIRFELDGADYLVEEVLDQWDGTDCHFLKLRANDGNLYILRHCLSGTDDSWSLTSFRKEVA
jgi:hypothetical protein